MTQRSLRYRTGLYAAILVVIDLFMLVYVEKATTNYIQYEFNKEMLMRVSFVSAMAEWITPDRLTSGSTVADIADVSSITVGVQVLTKGEPHIESLALSSGYPTYAYKYSPILDAIISVREGEVARRSTGCNEEFVGVAMCFFATIPILLFGTLSIANLVARSGRRGLSKLIILLGYLVLPCGLTTGLLALFAYIQTAGSRNSWEADVGRSAILYGAMFNAMHTLLSTSSAELLGKTFEKVNEAATGVDDKSYQVTVAVGATREVSPPLYSDAVHHAIFDDVDSRSIKKTGTAGGYFYATYSIPVVQSLIIVIREIKVGSMLTDAQYLPIFICGMAMNFFFGVVFVLLLFPFVSLGFAGPAPRENASPWDNRLPRLWPYVKLWESLLLLVLGVAVLIMVLVRMSLHFNRVQKMRDFYLNLLTAVKEMQIVGNLIARCYAGVLGNSGGNLDFMYVSSVVLTGEDAMDVAEFYNQLTLALGNAQYAAYSTGNYLAAEPQNQWPALANIADVKEFLASGSVGAPGQMATFQTLVKQYDNAIIVAVLRNDVAFLNSGNPTLQQEITAALQQMEPTTLTEADLQSAFQTVTLSCAPYADIASTYNAQTVGVETFVDLYATDLGQKASAIEEEVSLGQYGAIPQQETICLSYAWPKYNSLIALFVVSFLYLFYYVFDACYTLTFFANAPWSWVREISVSDGMPVELSIPSSDYTHPHSFLHVSSYKLRRGYRALLGGGLYLVLLTVVFTAVFWRGALRNLEELENQVDYYQSSLVSQSVDVTSASVMELAMSAWSRAYLSLTPAHVNNAILMTSGWTRMQACTWVEGNPDTDSSQFDTHLLEKIQMATRNMTIQTSLLRHEPAGQRSTEGIYTDMIGLLGEYDRYINFAGYTSCFGAMGVEWQQFFGAYLDCLVFLKGNECYHQSIRRLVLFSNMCQVPPDFELYLWRVAGLQQRSAVMLDHSEVAQLMESISPSTNKEVLDMVGVQMNEFEKIKTDKSMWLPWILMGYAWLAAPVLFLNFRAARQVHHAMYAS